MHNMYRKRHNSPPLVKDNNQLINWWERTPQRDANRLLEKSSKRDTEPVQGDYIGKNVYISYSSKPLLTKPRDCASIYLFF